jgi:hypothetical protein
MTSRQSAGQLGGFEQRLLNELMQMIAEPRQATAPPSAQYGSTPQVPAQHGPRWQRPAGRRRAPRRRATAVRPGHGRIRVALTASLAAAAVTAVAVAIGVAEHDAPAKTQAPPETTSAGPGFPAANQAFYQVVNVGAQLRTDPGIRSACEILWYYTPLTGRYFQSVAEPCAANPQRTFPGWAVLAADGHGFPALPTLSDRPVTLLGQLSRAADRGARYWGVQSVSTGRQTIADLPLTTHAAVMFALVERLLEMPVSHALRDALCQVGGQIPGVGVHQRVRDIAGLRGVTFRLLVAATQSTADFAWFVLAPGSHQFLGLGFVQRTRDGRSYSMTVVHSGLVREN